MDKIFNRSGRNEIPFSLNYGGRLIDFRTPLVMGILNVTPDSFYDGGKFIQETVIRERIRQMVSEGAAIIDIGGASSRPGSAVIPVEDEWNRIAHPLSICRNEFPDVMISVDTWRAEIVRRAVSDGPMIVNDISGGTMDDEMFKTIAEHQVPYVLMHIQHTPADMQVNPQYHDVTVEVIQFLARRCALLRDAGVKDIIIDPGFGFGKSTEHNYTLLNNLQAFKQLICPVLTGFSRKGMIGKLLGIKPEQSLNGTYVLNTIALMNGAHILRVHDVKEAVEAVRLYQAFQYPSSISV